MVMRGARPRVSMLRASEDASDGSIDVESKETTYAQCMSMKVSEIKAELELRKIGWEGLFEKEELAKLLAESRRKGKADPSLLDEFNKQSVNAAWEATPDTTDVATESPDLSDATAADGALPGGMSPDMLKAASENPEIMGLLRNPKLQDVMRKMMADGPEATSEMLAADPEARELLQKFQSLSSTLQK